MKTSLPLKIALLIAYVVLCTSLVLDGEEGGAPAAGEGAGRAFSPYPLP
jgi:hypothetical protein